MTLIETQKIVIKTQNISTKIPLKYKKIYIKILTITTCLKK